MQVTAADLGWAAADAGAPHVRTGRARRQPAWMANPVIGMLAWLALLAPVARAANPPVGATVLVAPASPEARRFSGVARMSGCTAFLIQPPGAGPASPAYVMTAGHCVDLGANDVIVDRADASRTAIFGLLHGVSAPMLQVRSRRVVYSTMKGVDLALVELDSSLGALESAGVAPLELARFRPAPLEAVEWAGVPSTGVPPDERFLRTGECTLAGFADVLEWRWQWRGQIRHDCSDISGGASGSPLVARASGLVIGVIGTTNVGNPEPTSDGLCGRNDPCETGADGSVWRRNTSYATPALPAASCFDSAGAFRLTAPGCGLDPGIQARVLEPRLAVQPGAAWSTAVTSDTLAFFRYKIFREGSGDCGGENGYGQPAAIPGRITDPLPDAQGRYFLCVVAGVSPLPDAGWQPLRFASVVHLRVDGEPPAGPPRFSLWRNQRTYRFIPDASLVTAIALKVDTGETSTCPDTSNYRRIYAVPFTIAEGARRLCLLVEDAAGNAGSPWEIDLVNPAIFPVGVTASAGYEPARAAPGSWISIFGLNFVASEEHPNEGRVRVLLNDANGREFDLTVGYASPGQINARLPDNVPPGAAEVAVITADGKRVSSAMTIAPSVPGIFTADSRANGFGVISGMREDGAFQPTAVCSGAVCELYPLEGMRIFSILVNGLGIARDVRVAFSDQAVEVLAVAATALPGVDEVRVRLPEGLRLRGYIPVTIANGDAVSRPAYVWRR